MAAKPLLIFDHDEAFGIDAKQCPTCGAESGVYCFSIHAQKPYTTENGSTHQEACILAAVHKERL